MRFLLLLILAATAVASDEFPMRSRVCYDVTLGIAVRYPYDYFAPDQSVARFWGRPKRSAEGKVVRRMRRMDVADLAVAGFPQADAPGATLQQAGERVTGPGLTWQDQPFYIEDPARPFRSAAWAPPGIAAAIGTGKGVSALVVKHGDRFSVVMVAGGPDEGENRSILDSLEVLVTAAKSADKPTPAKPLKTWREHQWQAGKVVGRDGRVSTATPHSWSEANEIETAHYHVTGLVPPARLVYHGQYLEALYRAYSKVFKPERMPPVKFEVHIFDTYDRFRAAAAAWGNALPGGPGIVGGFFVPGLLSLWVYEESGKLGGKDFTIEHVTAHECSHQFLHVGMNGSEQVPTWVNEGLAVYFECGKFEGGEFRVYPPMERIAQLKQLYGQTKRPLAGTLSQYIDHHGHITADMYGEVFAMVYYFVFGSGRDPKTKKSGLDLFQEYMVAMRGGEDGAKAFDRIFMSKLIDKYGSRDQAYAAWNEMLVRYVIENKNWTGSAP